MQDTLYEGVIAVADTWVFLGISVWFVLRSVSGGRRMNGMVWEGVCFILCGRFVGREGYYPGVGVLLSFVRDCAVIGLCINAFLFASLFLLISCPFPFSCSSLSPFIPISLESIALLSYRLSLYYPCVHVCVLNPCA